MTVLVCLFPRGNVCVVLVYHSLTANSSYAIIEIEEYNHMYCSSDRTRLVGRLIPYYRVSTRKQGESGLGLEAQQSCVADFARYGQHEIIATYQEIETGKRADRPELTKAIAHSKRAKATLVIAKLDRLARNVHFLSGLMESRVDFVCCDNPHANRLTLHILAAVAEDEARRISERTKAALAAYKARGGRLGTPANLTPEAGRRGAAATRAKARTAYAAVLPELGLAGGRSELPADRGPF